MSAYVIANVEIHDPKKYEEYRKMVPATIAAFGGKFIARGGATQVLEGSWTPKRVVILEFPSVARARAWWDSPEYAPAKALRQSCSTGDLIIVDGVPS